MHFSRPVFQHPTDILKNFELNAA